MNEKTDITLGIPIYLDVETLLDLIATLDDGFKKGSKVTFNNNSVNGSNNLKEGSIGFGIPFINVGGKISKNKEISHSKDEFEEYEKYHTYGSLMNMLLKKLRKDNNLNEIKDGINFDNLKESNFVLLGGKLLPNPLTDFFKKIDNILKFIYSIEDLDFSESSKKNIKKGKNKKNRNDVGNKQKIAIMKLVERIIKELENKNYQKYIVNIENSNFNALMYLFEDYIRDHSGVELPLGEYKVLGKIVRKVDSNETIDWQDGTTLDSINLNLIEEFEKKLSDTGNILNLPEIGSTKIEGKIIQIIPIAIFI